ncbi:hypothetical protein ONZ43_g199 [Nemania bipapillata]|uniref:Uncharacterized protein n=1 Tax=Nemania bipapillata TaxID=110536 RepID=A0ACC2J961_9PEZI|nr:hypothetical protein ONZ43_g199 [Nemania bipapillata]
MNPDLGHSNDSCGGGRLNPDNQPSTRKPKEHKSHRSPYGRGVGKDSSANHPSNTYEQSSGSKGTRKKLKKGNPQQDEKATHETIQRLEQELHSLKQRRDYQEQQIDDLKAMLREREDKSSKLKRRNEKLQSQIDNDESTLGHQQPDEVVLSQFRSLKGSIKIWASKWFSSTSPHDIGFDFDWSVDGDFKIVQSILPSVNNKEDFADFFTDVKNRRRFVRGWIGFHVARDIFRTLPAAANIRPFLQELGSDIWIPTTLRSQVSDIELAFLNSGDSTTPGEFNQWRSLTMSLLFKKYPGISEETIHLMEERARRALRPIISALSRADRDHAKQKLIENVYKPALELSQLMRRQRAVWSVRFLYGGLQSRDERNTTLFNERFMNDTEDLEDEDEPKSRDVRWVKRVDIVVTPLLYKSGTIDGKQYDVESVVERAEVFCAPSDQQY